MIKAAFFDIDGTLVSFNTHKVSDSSKEAIKQLRKKGIKVFVASGRALFQINNLEDIELDGYITVNGGCCFVKENGSFKEIFRVSLAKEDLFSLMNYLNDDNNKFPCSLVTSNCVSINYIDDIINILYGMANINPPKTIDFNDYIPKNYSEILQLNIFVDDNREKHIMSNILKNSMSSRWHFSFADVNPKCSGKNIGIDKIIEYCGIDLSETIAFGDGGNDMTMIEHAGIGVAMGNANEALKEIADYITDDVDNNGVYNALKHFNII